MKIRLTTTVEHAGKTYFPGQLKVPRRLARSLLEAQRAALGKAQPQSVQPMPQVPLEPTPKKVR